MPTPMSMGPTGGRENVSGRGPENDPDVEIGSWTDVWRIDRFRSKAAGADVDYYLYLPPGYDTSNERFPVVYWLHGIYARPFAATPIVLRLDRAIRAGTARPMIVVSCLDPSGTSMWTDSKDGRVPIETVIIEELLPHVDATYRTIAERRGRTIEGFSMGGYGAAYLGLKYMDLFAAASVLSGALHTPETLRARRQAIFESVFGGDMAYADQRSPWTIARRRADAVRGRMRIRVFVGEEDGLLDWNRDYHELLEELDIPHQWGVVPGATHDIERLMEKWQGDYFSYYA